MKLKSLWLTSGVPGSGKSSWIKDHLILPGMRVVSRDKIRFAILEQGEDYFSREDEVFNEYVRWAQDLINDDNIDGPIILDATHMNEKSRNKILNRLNLNHIDSIHIFWFDVSLDVCLERNDMRTGLSYVPKSVLRRMWYQYIPPSENEKYKYIIHHINEQGDEIYE